MAKQRTSAVSESAPMEEYSVSAASGSSSIGSAFVADASTTSLSHRSSGTCSVLADAEDTSSVVSFQLHGGHIYAKKPSEDTPNMVDDTPSLGSRGSMQLSGMTDESYRSSALFYTPGVEASTPTPTVTSSVQQPQKRSAPLPIYKLLSNGDECHDSPLLGSLPASRKRQRVGRNRRSVQQTNPVEGAAQGMGLLDHIISGVLL